MNYTTIAWDWNGTLLDDAYICMECVNDMLRKRNMDVLDLDTYRRLVETPIIKAYEHIFDLSVVTFDTIVKEFYDSYPRYAASAKLIEGAGNVLEFFKKKECRQIILTAAHTSQVEGLLCRFHIADYFDTVIGASDFKGASKLDRAVKYTQNAQWKGEKTLMIGDTLHDAETADAIGADCILFSGGHQDEGRLIKSGKPVVKNLSEIPGLVG